MSTIEGMRQCPNCGRYMVYNTTTGYFCPTCYTKPPVITTSLSADRNIERIAAALESIAESLAALAQVEGEQEMNDIRVSVEIPGAFGADVDLRFDNDILIKQTWGITTDEAIALRDALLAKYPVERWEPVGVRRMQHGWKQKLTARNAGNEKG